MTTPIDQQTAETIAIRALAALASDDALLQRFLAVTGIAASDIRAAAAQPGFLAGVLAFYTAHEPSLVELARQLGEQPEAIVAAARALPLGDDRYERST